MTLCSFFVPSFLKTLLSRSKREVPAPPKQIQRFFFSTWEARAPKREVRPQNNQMFLFKTGTGSAHPKKMFFFLRREVLVHLQNNGAFENGKCRPSWGLVNKNTAFVNRIFGCQGKMLHQTERESFMSMFLLQPGGVNVNAT